MPWTADIIGGVFAWQLDPAEGSAGVTRCSISYLVDILPNSALIRFRIDASIMATLNLVGLDSPICP